MTGSPGRPFDAQIQRAGTPGRASGNGVWGNLVWLLALGLAFGIQGWPYLSWGTERLGKMKRIDENAAVATGTVVGTERLMSWGRNQRLRREQIRYRFQTSEGEIIEGTDILTLPGGDEAFRTGQKSKIAYHRTVPKLNRIDLKGEWQWSYSREWSYTLFVAAGGGLFVLAGILFWLFCLWIWTKRRQLEQISQVLGPVEEDRNASGRAGPSR